MTMHPTRLEDELLKWFALNSGSTELQIQLHQAKVVEREFSGAGSFTELQVPESVPELPESYRLVGENGPIQGPDVSFPGVAAPVSSLLWFSNRKASSLEIAGGYIIDSHPTEFAVLGGRRGDA
jgi:hypothetical protein